MRSYEAVGMTMGLSAVKGADVVVIEEGAYSSRISCTKIQTCAGSVYIYMFSYFNVYINLWKYIIDD